MHATGNNIKRKNLYVLIILNALFILFQFFNVNHNLISEVQSALFIVFSGF